MLKKCEAEGLGFIPWFPLDAGGMAKEAIEEVARSHDATPMQVALAWLLAHSPATLPIPGTSSVPHLEQNVEAAALRLDDEDLVEARRGGRMSPLDPRTHIGHVHLKVSDLERAERFYVDVIGFEVTARYGTEAVFLAAGDYHHHLGLNTWQS